MFNRLGIIFWPAIAFAVVVFCAAGVVAIVHQSNATELALRQAEVTTNTVLRRQLDQETGLRGYIATGDAIFLKPYHVGLARFEVSVAQARAQLLALHDARALSALADEQRIHDRWVREVAEPLLRDPSLRNIGLHLRGKALVDAFRDDNDRMIAALNLDAGRLERRNQFAIGALILGGFALGTFWGRSRISSSAAARVFKSMRAAIRRCSSKSGKSPIGCSKR